jgi:alpha-L-rhamnosidase
MIQQGSNTIWERWDYDTRDPGMNSESLLIQAGNVDAWFYQTLGGINYDPSRPGFAHIIIHPHMLGNLTWVKCRFDSPYGRIISDWTRHGQNATLDITIPANTTGTVTTPDGVAHEVMSGTWVLNSPVN